MTPDPGTAAGYIIPGNVTYPVWVGDINNDATEEQISEAFRNKGLNIVKV